MHSAATKRHPLAKGSGVTWSLSILALVICIAAIIFIGNDDIARAVSTWTSIPTYSYCFLVLPIALWLIYGRRRMCLVLEPSPSPWGLTVVAMATMAWLVGQIASVIELRQLALVGMVDGAALAILGPRICRRLLLPLLYLFLLVPTGTVLLPALQAETSALTVALLHLQGLPVLVDGATVEVPHGVYEIAPGCAGLNFLLASLALSLVYGDQLYRRPGKRLACVAVALALAVLANGVRVYGIIAIAELSERRIDIVEDHL